MMIILITANFEFTDKAFNGSYSDFNDEWFHINGRAIINIMLV